jgi:hypothetical protein
LIYLSIYLMKINSWKYFAVSDASIDAIVRVFIKSN